MGSARKAGGYSQEAPATDVGPSVDGGQRRTRLEFAALAAVAIAVPLAWWIAWTVVYGGHNFNDFHDFWLAGKLITEGHSPYDKHALDLLGQASGLHFVLGTGYSYPLPFAVAMIPFSWLPFTSAVLLFNGIGLALFGVSVASWIRWAHGSESKLIRRRFLLAILAGSYPSVYGTLANGQACLVLMPFLAFGCIAMLDGDTRGRLGGGIAVGLAAIVKLTPGAMVVPLVLARRVSAAGGVVAGALGALAIATLLVPFAGEGSGGLSALTEPDSYFTNQSINGAISRLVLPSERTTPLFSHAFDPWWPVVVVTALFGLATVAVLWQSRTSLAKRHGLALGLGITVVASLIGAPKGTYWNQVMILVPVGLLLAVETPGLNLRKLPPLDLCLIAAWLVGTWIQTVFWMFPPPKTGDMEIVTMLLTSSSTYGLLALWLVFARRLHANRVAT